MRKINNLFKIFILSAIIIAQISIPKVYADKDKSRSIPFTVTPILTEEQNDNIKSYISIKTDKNTNEHEFKFKIKNESDQEKIVEAVITNAYTSPSGTIQYVVNETKDAMLTEDKNKLTNYANIDESIITLKAKGTKIITINITDEEFDGTMLGGIRFKDIDPFDNEESDNNGINIKNEINMVVGIVIEKDTISDINFKTEKVSLEVMPSSYDIKIPIISDGPHIVKDIKMNYVVSKNNKELFNGIKNLDFAPYAKTNISVNYDYNEIINNEPYNIEYSIEYIDKDSNKKIVKFEDTFKFKGSNSIANLSKELTRPKTRTSSLVIIIPLLLILVVALYYIRKHKSQNKINFQNIKIDNLEKESNKSK